MTRLKQRLVDLIEALGPLPVSEYMALCLFDPTDGYYTTREPFGASGDFITAPEISQMFGELVAVWLYSAWRAQGAPIPATVAEIGPGRGTLARDMLRTLTRLDPDFARHMSFALVETSPRLTDIQKQTLAGTQVEWHQSVGSLPEAPLFIVGNELFDAIPMRQFVKSAEGWRERVVVLSDTDELCFAAGAGSLDLSLLPPDAANAAEGTIVELAPARTALMAEVAGHIAKHGGAGLFIDYGHLEPGVGDTFQAVRRHRHEDVLASPGEADLTSHVDFATLAEVARRGGPDAHIATQRSFLLDMGIVERAGRLGAATDAARREKLTGEVERLVGADAMGQLFKVLAVAPRGLSVPGFAQEKGSA